MNRSVCICFIVHIFTSTISPLKIDSYLVFFIGVSIVNDVAKEVGIDKIYFYDFVKNREDNNGTYEAIVERLSSYVTYNDYSVADIYAPSLLVVCNDEVLLFDTETSFRSGNIAPSEYWNSLNIENKKSELREIFRTYLES